MCNKQVQRGYEITNDTLLDEFVRTASCKQLGHTEGVKLHRSHCEGELLLYIGISLMQSDTAVVNYLKEKKTVLCLPFFPTAVVAPL
jgi:hypothetical protein